MCFSSDGSLSNVFKSWSCLENSPCGASTVEPVGLISWWPPSVLACESGYCPPIELREVATFTVLYISGPCIALWYSVHLSEQSHLQKTNVVKPVCIWKLISTLLSLFISISDHAWLFSTMCCFYATCLCMCGILSYQCFLDEMGGENKTQPESIWSHTTRAWRQFFLCRFWRHRKFPFFLPLSFYRLLIKQKNT